MTAGVGDSWCGAQVVSAGSGPRPVPMDADDAIQCSKATQQQKRASGHVKVDGWMDG